MYADVYDLGTVNVGTGFNDTLVTATGGVDKISINYVGNSPFTNGITGLGSANAGVATYLISGTPTAIGEKLILLQASDVHGNKSKVVAYKLKIEGADVTYSMTGETIEAGKASATENIIEWYAVSGYTASAESKNLVISNNSEKDIEVSVAYQTDYYSTSDSEGSTKFPIAGLTNGKVTVPKRGSSTLTITPKSGLTSGGSVSTILIIAGTGMKPTAINLSFKVNVNDLEITKPAGTYTWSGTTARYVEGTPYDLNLEIGKPFTFQIGTTASENVESVEWAITGFNGRTGAAEIKTELAAYGLSINENTGILVGTPKKALTNAGKLYVKATPTLKANTTNNAVPVPCVFNVTIKGSADEFSLTANGNTIDSSENVLDLGTISIDRIDAVSQTFNVMNVSSLDIENVKVSMDHIKKGDTYSSALTGTSYQYDTYFKLIFDEDNSNLNEELGKGFELAVGESRDVMLEAGVGFGKNYSNVGTYWIPVEVVDQADSTNGIAKFVAKIKVTDAPVIDASAITGIVANSEIKESSSTIKYTLKMDNTDETKNYTYQWTSGSIPGLTLSESGVVYGTATEAGEFEVTVTATNKKDSSITGVLTHKVVVNGNATLELKASNLSGFVNNYILLPGIIVGDEVNKTVQTFNISSNNDTAKNVKITVEDAPDDRNNASDIKESPENPYIGSTNYIGVNKTGFTEITTQGTENFSIVTKSSVAPGVYKVKITVSADNANKQVFYVIMAVVEKFAITTPTDITTKIGKAYTIKADDGTSYIEDGDLEIVATGGAGRQTITWSEAGTKDSSGSTKYYVTKNGTAGTASDVTGFTLVGSRGRIDGKATTNASTTLVDPAATTGSKAYLTATAVKASGDYSVTLKAKVDAADYINGDGVSYRDDMSKAIYLNESNLVKASSTKAFPAQEATSVTFTISSGKAEDVKVTGVTGATGAGTIEGFKNGDVYVTTTGFTYDPVNPSYTNTSLGISVNVSNYMVGISTKVKAAFSENSNFEVVNASETTIQAATNANTPGVGAFQIRPKAKLAKGTYTDTLTISGNEFESITFDVSFTVEDASYVADVIGTVDDEDVKYVENSVVTGNILSLDNYVVDATKVSETLTVANVGNSALSRVSAYEVKADGTKYATGSADTMLTVGVISTTIAAGAQNTFTIRASKNTAGVYTTYVNLHYTEGTADTAVERDVWFPVTYTVYAKDIDTINVSPETKTTITVAENYEPASAATEFVVTNTGSDVTSTLVGYTVRSTNSNFEVLPSTAEELAAGSSATFKLQPKQGKMLSAGEYTTKLRVSGGNIKTAVERDVTLVVTESEEYTIKAYTAGYDIEDTSIAEKFWNTFAYGKNVSLTSENSNATKIMDVDVDEDRTPDIALTFTFDNNVTDKDSAKSIPINKVNVKLLSTNISTATQSLTLKTTEQTAAKSGHGDTYSDAGDAHDAKFFTTVNINFYGTVVFGTTNNTEYAELKTNLENDNVVVQTTVGGTGANKNNAKGTITAYVPFASKLGSVFASGKLPTAVSAGSIMNAWKKNGTSIIVSADRVIYSDYALDPDYHTHSYAEANNKDEKYVKWVWSTDEKGNLSTVLHLYCTDPDCPDYAGSEIVITDSALTTDTSEIAIWKNGDSLVTYDARAGKDADCEHGSRYEYPAQAKINSITYKNSYIEAEEGKPLGHQFNLKVDAEIVWTDKNSDGIMTADEVTVTRTCTRCGEPVALTVVGVSEKDRVEPTCTKDGSVQYVITYTEVTEDGKTGSNVSKDYKEVTVLKATGHAKELLAEVTDFNEETLIAEKLTLTCPDCGDVLFEGTKLQFTKNEDGTYGYKALIASTGEYYTVSYTNHAHVWDGVWSWSADNSQATLTITCTQGSRPEVREFTVDAVVTKKGAEYTYTVSKTYTWTEKGEAKTKDFSETKTVVKTDDGKAIEDVTKISDGIYIEGLDDDYWYTGNAIQPTFDVIDASERLVYLVKGVDYTVSYKNNKEVGTAQIIVKGKGNYAGQSTEGKFEIKDPKKNVEKDAPTLKGAKLELPKKVSYSYTGAPQYPAYLTLTLKGLSAVQYDFDGTSYYDKDGNEIPAVWTISNNLNKGTATITLTGPVDGKSNVQIKKTFSIKAAELATGNTTVEVGEENWSAKGALPPVTVTWKSAVTETSYQLVQGLDYTVTYNNNKVPGSQAASVTIKGKGNFSKTLKNVAKFDVGALELDDNMIRSATVYGGVKGSAVKVTLLDPYNDVIPASKYQVIVTDMNDAQVTSAKLVAGETYKVTVTPKAKTTEFTGEASQEFVAGLNLASASVKLNKGFEKTFTGEYIELTEDDFKNIAVSAKVNKVPTTLEYDKHFTVTGYTNNLKKGTMTVTITGTGEADENGVVFSGTKTFKVKIVAKTLK